MTNRYSPAYVRGGIFAFASIVIVMTGLVLRAQPGDMQPPSITVAVPSSGATGVAVTTTIRVTFNEPVQPASVTIQLRDANSVLVSGIPSYDATTRTASFDPSLQLQGSVTYRVTVLPATDLAGNSMASPVQWSFTTGFRGFQESIVFSGLVEPTVLAFASDGRVFVAEKSGLIKVFASLTATTPTIFADLRTNAHNYADRGLLGMALHPNFPATPYVYVLYTYDAAKGGTAPRWGLPGGTFDDCPTPPGPTDDGCVVSGRLSRLQAAGSQMIGTEKVLVED